MDLFSRSMSTVSIFRTLERDLTSCLVNDDFKTRFTTREETRGLWNNLRKNGGPALLASFLARSLAMTLCYPFDVQAFSGQGTSGKITKQNQVKKVKFTTGYGIAMTRDLSLNMAFFPTYETLKPVISQNICSAPVMVSMIASFFASAAGIMCSYPFDLARTLKIVYPERFGSVGVYSLLRLVMKERGFRGFFDGLPPRLVKQCFGNLIFFAIYQQVKEIFYSMEKD